MLPSPHLPATGAVFVDDRGDDRALRISWHDEAGVVVLSLWRDNVCVGSFRLSVEQVPELIASLAQGLSLSYDAGAARGA